MADASRRSRSRRSRSRRRRRRSFTRSVSRARTRRREASRERAAAREERAAREREQRRREAAERTPNETIAVRGIPEDGVQITEQRLEAAAWDVAVQAGSSMPTSLSFVWEEQGHRFSGTARLVFPHKEAARLFMDHTLGTLEVDGHRLALKYHHTGDVLPGRSRSHDRDRAIFPTRGLLGEPSATLMIKGIDPRKHQASGVDTISMAFRPFATIKDIRLFAQRGFAFVQFHTVEDATTALRRFESDYQGRLDGDRVLVNFAQDRDQGRVCDAERSFLAKQAAATASATAELEAMARQQMQEENTSKALSGVNASMWASYMQSVAHTETVQSSNTFEYDKASGFYLDKKAGLLYDPNTTYFFTTDYQKYFVYDHEEGMLCHVDSQGQKVPDGERRQLPSQAKAPLESTQSTQRTQRTQRENRERSASRRRDQRERVRGRRHDQERRRELDPDVGREAEGGLKHERERERRRDLERERERWHIQEIKDGRPQPIHYPGGDPLAKLAPAPDASQAAAAPQKKKRKEPEQVLGLADTHHIARPGPVQVFAAPQPGPVIVAGSRVTGPMSNAASVAAASVNSGADFSAVSADGIGRARLYGANGLGEWICDLCMRKFGSEEQLRRHEQLSDLHKQNLAKFQAQA